MTPRHRAPVTGEPGEPDRPPVGSELGFLEAPLVGSTQPAAIDTLQDAPPVPGSGIGVLRGARGAGRIGDRVFGLLASGSGVVIIALITLVAVFLVTRAVPSIAADESNFLFSRGFSVSGSALRFGVLDLLWVTVISSVIALVIAVPIAVGIALFLTQVAAPVVRRPIGYVIDLLAAIPSIIYGLWGIYILAPHLEGIQRFMYHFGFIPLFKNEGVTSGSIFNAGVVLAIMILPIVTAISRDVFDRTPSANIEAAWALGATRWEMIRMAVLPYGRSGLISGAMLGLGRALGETIAVMLILSKPSADAPFTFSIFAGGQTFASLIGLNMQEANGVRETGAYIAAGLVLFVLTFAVNAAARAIANRRVEFS